MFNSQAAVISPSFAKWLCVASFVIFPLFTTLGLSVFWRNDNMLYWKINWKWSWKISDVGQLRRGFVHQMVLIKRMISNLLLLTEARHLPGSEIKAFVSLFHQDSTWIFWCFLFSCWMPENLWYTIMKENGGKASANDFPPLSPKKERKRKLLYFHFFLLVSDLFVMFMQNPYCLKLP